jgi:hypothetical protein
VEHFIVCWHLRTGISQGDPLGEPFSLAS